VLTDEALVWDRAGSIALSYKHASAVVAAT